MSSWVLKPVGDGDSIPFSGEVVIGRATSCNVVLKTGTVSGRHARLTLKDSVASLEDLGSTNGTFVNGQKIVKPTQLKHGDRVRFDVVEFDVVMPPQGDRTQVRSGTVIRPSQATERPPVEAATPAPNPAASASAPPAVVARPAIPAPPAVAAAPPPAAAAPPAAPAPPSGATPPPTPSPAPRRAPGAWADPSNRVKSKTVFISDRDLKEFLGEPVVAESALREPHLQVLSGSSRGKSLPLTEAGNNGVWKIGSESGDGDKISLADPGVSAFHATIEHKGARWKVVDQMSANGTYVNGARVTTRFLNSGDVLKFGPTECVFRLPTAARSSARGRRSFWLRLIVSFVVTVVLLYALLRWLNG